MSNLQNQVDKLLQLTNESAATEHLKPLSKSTNPRMFADWVGKNIAWAESKIDKVEKQVGISSSCSIGCNACCYQAIGVSGTEAKAIKGYMQRKNLDERKSIYAKIQLACKLLDEKVPLVHQVSLANQAEFRQQYFEAHIKCPLLSDEGKCTVYPVRPASCWGYRMYGEPNECSTAADVDYTATFHPFEHLVIDSMIESSPAYLSTHKHFHALPFSLLEVLKDIV